MSKLPAWLHFKNKSRALDVLHIHWSLAMIMAAMSGYAQKNKLPMVVTSGISSYAEDTYYKRVSTTHREGRAMDISVKGWQATDIEKFVEFWNGHEYNQYYGAISSTTKQPNLVVYHSNGNGFHCHVQVRRD